MKTPFQVICLVALVLLVLFFPVAAAPVADYQPVCTPPVCPSGKYVCLLKEGCSGGCGMTCNNSVTLSTTVTTPVNYYQPVCTPPVCPSGKYVCMLKDGCSGGCGMSCNNSVTLSTTVTTPVNYYQPVCTPPVCPSGKYICLQKDGCPGGCGYSCETVSPPITVPPTTSGIETVVILLAIGLGVVVFAKRRN